jgi:hypothetical protein
LSLAVSKLPAGAIAFWVARALTIVCTSTPSVASLVFESSMNTFSSCSPMSSTLATSGTRSSSRRMRSAYFLRSAYANPSPVRA